MPTATESKAGISRGPGLAIWLMVAVLAIAIGGLGWYMMRGDGVVTTASGLRYQVIEEGTGEPATPADLVMLRYILTKEDGTVIQNSDDTGQLFVTRTSDVFEGFAEGLQLMRAGGSYKLWVPPGLHYDEPQPGAPFTPQDTLVFEIFVHQIGRGMANQNPAVPGATTNQAQPTENVAEPAESATNAAR